MSAAQRDATRRTILVVEGNLITRRMVHAALEKAAVRVLDANDGEMALRLLESERPDLVLQDLMLPDTDGFALVERLRSSPAGADIPILAFTGFLSKPEEVRVVRAGFDDIVSKPVEPHRLVQIVRAHLHSRAMSGDRFGVGRRMIVADDDSVQRKLVVHRMTQLGFDVVAVGDGAEALEKARAIRPDVILTDVMMPRLDGFGLCLAIRRDPTLKVLPLVLVSNSYVEEADHELARRAGANAYVVRTPELREAVEAVRESLAGAREPTPVPTAKPLGDLERDRTARVLEQLDRQVAMNAGLSQRCATLSAELTVLRGISEALTRHLGVDDVLRQLLAACFDAGGVSAGALYLLDEAGDLRARGLGGYRDVDAASLVAFFGAPEVLSRAVRERRPIAIPSGDIAEDEARAILAEADVASMLVVPLANRDQSLGALFMAAKGAYLGEEDRVAFAESVANQIASALTLANLFAKKDASELVAREQAAVLRSVLDSIGDGVVVVDREGAFLVQNRAGEAFADISSAARRGDDREGSGLFMSDRTTRVPKDELPISRALRGESVDRVELFARRGPSQDAAWISVSARPLLDERGAIRGGVEAFRDVTRDKAMQEAMMVSERMASVGTLAAGVAHEINNPLSAIITNLDIAAVEVARLAQNDPSLLALHEVSAELRDAREGAERVRDIARDLKVFSRSEESEKRGPVDVHHVLDSSVRIAWNEIRHRARLVKDHGDIPRAHANESRLGQVFLNLLVNAAQAIPEGRASDNEIRITTETRGDRVAVVIADTGGGMPPEVLARIFTPFFTTKPSGIGTGLGLSICRHIVQAVGGEIEVASKLGEGSTFTVTLPISKETPAGESPPRAVELAPVSRRARILVVDDEAAIGTAIRRVLGALHDVTTVTSAADGIAAIAEAPRFDLVFCDLMMPTMTGMELHAEIARRWPEQAKRFVFLTGGAFTAEARAFLDDGTRPWLEKPFDVTTLRRTVSEYLQPTD